MCCGGRVCMLCTCLILVAVVIGFLFGFGVFKDGFHKVKDTVHYSHGVDFQSRPFLRGAYQAPPRF